MNNLTEMNFLSGKKTYILSAVAVLWAVAGVLLGNLTVEQAAPYLWAGLAAFSLRNAIK